jgi:hypothetical protein
MKKDFPVDKKDLNKSKNISNLSISQYRSLINEEFQVSEYWENMFKNIVETTFKNVK